MQLISNLFPLCSENILLILNSFSFRFVEPHSVVQCIVDLDRHFMCA